MAASTQNHPVRDGHHRAPIGRRHIASRQRPVAAITTALFLFAGGLAHAGGPGTDAATAKQVRLHERMAQFREAFVKADVATLEAMVAPNYVHTNDRSAPLPRAAWLESMAKRNAASEGGQSTITEFTTSDVTLSVAGDTAVGTGTTTMRGTRSGAPYGLRINFTQVWAWNGDDWYRVAFHDTYEQLKD